MISCALAVGSTAAAGLGSLGEVFGARCQPFFMMRRHPSPGVTWKPPRRTAEQSLRQAFQAAAIQRSATDEGCGLRTRE
jgi:hypothetical protein